MWFVLSLIAALFWGLNYVSAERLLGKISAFTLVTLELLGTLVAMLILGIARGSFLTDARTISNDHTLWAFLVLSVGSFALGNLAIVLSVAAKNATLAGLVEISYPLFIVLFSWLLLGTTHLTRPVLLGAALILAGVTVIYFAT